MSGLEPRTSFLWRCAIDCTTWEGASLAWAAGMINTGRTDIHQTDNNRLRRPRRWQCQSKEIGGVQDSGRNADWRDKPPGRRPVLVIPAAWAREAVPHVVWLAVHASGKHKVCGLGTGVGRTHGFLRLLLPCFTPVDVRRGYFRIELRAPNQRWR